MSRAVHIKGLDKLLKDLTKLGVKGFERIVSTTEIIAKDMERDAKRLAPFNKKTGFGGTLRENIFAQKILNTKVGEVRWKVLANAFGQAPYSAYMEFGTGGLVEVPDELKDIAIQFKGAGIREVNLMPQPFLYPALVQGRVDYLKALKQDLEDLTKEI